VLVDRLPTPQAYIVGHSPRGIGHRAVLRIHLLPAQWLAKYKVSSLTPFEEWATPPAQRMVGRVISVTQAGVASVLLGFDNADDLSDGWVDLYTLLRLTDRQRPSTWTLSPRTLGISANHGQYGQLTVSQVASGRCSLVWLLYFAEFRARRGE
jgi:hypothetical protein